MFRTTRALLQHRQPMIRFLGRRSAPSNADHTPRPHPEAQSQSLPDSFASYRQRTLQHGPLASLSGASAGGRSGASLGAVEPPKGTFFDRDELPVRFRRTLLDIAEIEAIETGGASLFA